MLRRAIASLAILGITLSSASCAAPLAATGGSASGATIETSGRAFVEAMARGDFGA